MNSEFINGLIPKLLVLLLFCLFLSQARYGGDVMGVQGVALARQPTRQIDFNRDTRTNTPLQSLNLMNDVTYIEAARMLAQRMLTEGGPTPQEQLAWAFRLVTSRPPGDRELQALLRNLEKQKASFSRRPQDAAKLMAVGEKRGDEKLKPFELAAYTMTASLILNLDEVITRQ